MRHAGFAGVEITPITITANFMLAERYAELQIEAASAAIPLLQQLDPTSRATLIEGVRREMEAPIRAQAVDGQLRFPMHAYLAQAHRPAL